MASLTSTSDSTSADDFMEVQRYKMLLVGETGSGKTSFIKLLLNIAKQDGKDFVVENITSFLSSQDSRKNWESDTLTSTSYQVAIGDFRLDIIDTPGFADNRGEEQCEANIADIIRKVQEERYINCICVVINGTQSRLTQITNRVITEIVSILPSFQNTWLLFTNARDQYSVSFDTDVLKEYDLLPPQKYIFAIDNPYARWLKAKHRDERFKTKIKTEFYDTNDILKKMFKEIKILQPVPTNKFGKFYLAVQEIEACLVTLQVHHDNKNKVEEKINNIRQYLETNEGVLKKMKTTYAKVEVRASERSNVICSARGCYCNCHQNCECGFTFLSVRFCKKLWFGCKNPSCRHSITQHRIGRFYLEKLEADIPLPQNIMSVATTVEKKEDLIELEKPTLTTFEETIAQKTDELEKQVQQFQSILSSTYFSTIAKKKIEMLKEEVNNLPAFINKEKIITILDDTVQVLQDPINAPNNDTKFRWACGLLEIDPDHVSEAEISRGFQQQLKNFNSCQTPTSGVYKYVHHARDYLKTNLASILRRRQ